MTFLDPVYAGAGFSLTITNDEADLSGTTITVKAVPHDVDTDEDTADDAVTLGTAVGLDGSTTPQTYTISCTAPSTGGCNYQVEVYNDASPAYVLIPSNESGQPIILPVLERRTA